MTGLERTRAKLDLLLQNGGLPKSTCGGAFLRFVGPLLHSGVIVEERFGAGRRLAVRDADTLRAWVQSRFPDVPVFADASSRVTGLARFRDSKAFADDTPDRLTLRSWSETAVYRDGVAVAVSEGTREHGVFSFVLDERGVYEIRTACALVENPAMLLAFERLGFTEDLPLAIYGGGRLSNRVLAWLAKQSCPSFRLTHFPDYDPVGLSEFRRVQSAIGSRATLFIPPDLRQRFACFSKHSLLQPRNSQALLHRLRRGAPAEIRFVLDLIEEHNAGLEQEALLVSIR